MKFIAWYSPSCGGFWLTYESIPAHIIANGVLPLGHAADCSRNVKPKKN